MKEIKKVTVVFTDGTTKDYSNPIKAVMLKEILKEIKSKPGEYFEWTQLDIDKVINYAYDIYVEMEDKDVNPEQMALYATRIWDDVKDGDMDIDEFVNEFYDFDFDEEEL